MMIIRRDMADQVRLIFLFIQVSTSLTHETRINKY